MRAIAVVFAIASLGFVGCGGEEDEAASSPASASAIPFDRAFIDAMVPHHRSAIEMAKAAKTRGLGDPELGTMADEIIESQQREIDQMLAWREEWFGSRELGPLSPDVLGVPEGELGMGAMEHGSDEIYKAMDVDAKFAELMIPHHEGAIAMAKVAQERGEHEEIRTLAGEIIAAQEREIAMLRPHAMEGMNH